MKRWTGLSRLIIRPIGGLSWAIKALISCVLKDGNYFATYISIKICVKKAEGAVHVVK